MPLSADAIDDRLNVIQTQLYNARHVPELQDRFNHAHYDNARLDHGLDLFNTAYRLHIRQKEEYSEQYLATRDLYDLRDQVKPLYQYHRLAAKEIFADDPDRYNDLGLFHPLRRDFRGWFVQAKNFYTIFVRDTDALDTFHLGTGIPPTVIRETRDQFLELERLNNVQENEKSEAQIATIKRDQAIEDLEAYVRLFRLAARLAFRDDPQRFESLLMGPIP